MLIRFTPDAEAELAEARQWYAHQREDLDVDFMQCIDQALSRVIANPHVFPIAMKISDASSFAAFRSLCFMKLQQTRFR